MINPKFELILGPMFSGKTTLLIEKLSELYAIGFKVLYINHSIDSRSDKGFSTHSDVIQHLHFDTLYATKLDTLDPGVLHTYDVIGIDEAQFFDANIIEFVINMLEKHNKYVIVAGLIADYKRNRFGHTLDLIPLCDNLYKRYSYCSLCYQKKIVTKAYFTFREENNTEQISIGGNDKYIPLCRKCYIHKNHNE